ncbi:MAG: hypothetical protein HQM11_20695, partial [SAR324 cluster bacterium]|nr:hypothetical protein [SAR324 cluster bacterium]
MGKFRSEIHPSRWRSAMVVGLHYESSQLPGFIRNLLYDEVKPLSETLCLGIGGFNRDKGEGDHF